MFSRSAPERRGLALAIVGVVTLAAATAVSASDNASSAKPAVRFPNLVEGTLGGKPFQVRSALAGNVWGIGGGVGVIVLSDQPETCELRSAKKRKANARRIHLVLSSRDGGTKSPPMDVGYFDVGKYRAAEFSDVFIVWHDAGCRETRRATATKGTVNLRRYPREDWPNEYGGTFEIVVGKDRIKGSFTAPLCEAMSRGVADPPDFTEPECE